VSYNIFFIVEQVGLVLHVTFLPPARTALALWLQDARAPRGMYLLSGCRTYGLHEACIGWCCSSARNTGCLPVRLDRVGSSVLRCGVFVPVNTFSGSFTACGAVSLITAVLPAAAASVLEINGCITTRILLPGRTYSQLLSHACMCATGPGSAGVRVIGSSDYLRPG
jgi:hypothetical protein